jgi:hypothetical protein
MPTGHPAGPAAAGPGYSCWHPHRLGRHVGAHCAGAPRFVQQNIQRWYVGIPLHQRRHRTETRSACWYKPTPRRTPAAVVVDDDVTRVRRHTAMACQVHFTHRQREWHPAIAAGLHRITHTPSRLLRVQGIDIDIVHIHQQLAAGAPGQGRSGTRALPKRVRPPGYFQRR